MGKALRVLIIEDSEADTRLLLRELRRAGYEVEFERVETAEAMQSALAQQTWDLILSDYSLPGFNAPHALEVLKAGGLDLPFIIISGTIGEETAVNALKAGANDFLIKGKFARLGPAIERELREAESRRARKRAEMQLADAFELTERVLTASHIGILIYRFTGECISANAYAAQMIGATIGQLESQNFRELESWKQSGLYELAEKAIAGGRLAAADIHVTTTFGKDVWFKAQFVTFRSAGQELLLLTMRDITEHKRAEEKLLASEVRYRRLFEAARDGILILDADTGEIVDVNPFLIERLGYSYTEILGKQLWEIGFFTDIAANRAAFLKLQEERYIRYENLPLKTRDGSLLWVEFVSNAYDVDGKQVIQCNIRDITERKRAEERLSLQSTALVSSANAILITDRQGVIQWVNPAYERLTGYTKEEVLGRNPRILKSGTHDQPFYKNLWDTILAGRAWQGELHNRRKDGSLYVEDQTITPILGENGEVTHFVAIKQDVTSRRRAEEALRESESRYRELFEAESDALFLIDNESGNLLEANSAAVALYGYDRNELLTKRNADLSAEPEETQMVTHGTPIISDQVVTIPLRFHRKKDGTVFPVEITGRFFRRQGQSVHIAAIRDITERRRAEEALRAKNEEIKVMSQQLWQAAKLATMGELAASIAHELNNPLATVSLRTEMLLAQISPDDSQSRSLQIIDSEIKRMSTLVANLLQFSRRSLRQISTVKVHEEIAGTLDLLHYHLRKHNILMVQDFSPELPMVQVDRQQLRQVFLNLFTNAADAMPQGGTLTVRTWPGERPDVNMTEPRRLRTTASLGLPVSKLPQVLIEVSDTGEGIPPETLEQVWEPFFTTKPEGKGTGLGLAICRRIVQEHGGTIEIISAGIPGKGTTILITLPAVQG